MCVCVSTSVCAHVCVCVCVCVCVSMSVDWIDRLAPDSPNNNVPDQTYAQTKTKASTTTTTHTHTYANTHTQTHKHTQTRSSPLTPTSLHTPPTWGLTLTSSFYWLSVCVCVCVWYCFTVVASTVPPIIPDECAPALLPQWGPVAPQCRGLGDHLLPANCPAAPQDVGGARPLWDVRGACCHFFGL